MKTSTRTKSVDAFGQELLDYYHGENVVEIIERDDSFIQAATGNVKSYFSPYRNWFPAEKAAIRFARGRVLDVGCGAGRHSLYLQKKGLDVVGIDKSSLAAKVCRLRGVRRAIVLPFERVGDLSPKQFDTILMLGHNFGLFGSFEKARRMLRVLYRITNTRAMIIATTRDPHRTTSREHKEYQRLNHRRGRMVGQIRIRVRHKKLVGPWFDYLFVSKSELKRLIAGMEWRVKKFINQKDSPSYGVVLERVSV